MLRWRLLSATLIITPLLVLIVADFHYHFGAPGIWLVPLALWLTAAAVREVLYLFHGQNLHPSSWSVHAGAQIVVLAGFVPLLQNLSELTLPEFIFSTHLNWPLLAVAFASALIFSAEMLRFRQPGQSVIHVALGIMTVIYLAVPIVFLIALRLHHDNRWGMAALVSVIFVVKTSDAGAYFSGRYFGRRKLAPRISPKKTVAGLIGGLAIAAIASWIFFQLIVVGIVGSATEPSGWMGSLVYGLLIGFAGVIGDLSESLLKRDMQCKDSGASLPGLGGILDVLDSLLLAAPIAYFCWVVGLVGP